MFFVWVDGWFVHAQLNSNKKGYQGWNGIGDTAVVFCCIQSFHLEKNEGKCDVKDSAQVISATLITAFSLEALSLLSKHFRKFETLCILVLNTSRVVAFSS